MAIDEQLTRHVRAALAETRSVSEVKMFGGVGFLLRRNMLVGVWHDSLIVRIGPDDYETLLREPFAGPFDITGKAMTGWLMIAPDGIQDDGDLHLWIDRALDFVKTLPAK